jgi:hypothetical protein
LVLLVAAALAAVLESHHTSRTVSPAAMRVEVQPESGDLVTPTNPQVVTPLAAEPAGDPVILTRPDGGQYANVRGRFANYAVARRTPDGRLEHSCTTDLKTVETLLGTDPQAQPLTAAQNAQAVPTTDSHGWEVR